MKKVRFTETQIISVLKQQETGLWSAITVHNFRQQAVHKFWQQGVQNCDQN
jgi:hypothetical protein